MLTWYFRSTKAGGPRWAAASTSRGPITNYAKQVLSTAEPAAQQRAERQHRLRQQQVDQAMGLGAGAGVHSAPAPPAQPAESVPSLRLPAEAAPGTAQQRPQSARGTVAGGLLPHKANLWSTADVGQWLDSLGLSRYVPTFDENEIAGAILVDMTAEDLDYLDVKVLAHRKLLLKGITKLVQAVEAGDASGMSLPTPRSPPAHAYRMAPEGQQKDKLNVGAEAAASPAKGGNMVHWSALQPLAPQAQPEGGAMSVQGAPAQSKSLADMAYGEYDEAAEQAAFRQAVMAWRGGSGNSPGSTLAGTDVGGATQANEAWSNPADVPAPTAAGGRFSSSLGAFSSTLGGSTAPAGAASQPHAQPARGSVAVTRTAEAGSSTAAATQGSNSAGGRFNPLLAEGPDEAAEHAAFRDAVLAWRGEPAPAAAAAASGTAVSAAQASHGSGDLAAPNATLGAEAARALGVDPSAVESSTWYAGYKTLFPGQGGEGGVQAFNEHVRALHEAKRKARGDANQSPEASAYAKTGSSGTTPTAGAAGGHGGGGKVDEEGVHVSAAQAAVVEEGGVSSFVQTRVATSRGSSRAGATAASPASGGTSGVGATAVAAEGKEDDVQDMDNLPMAPQTGAHTDGLISLVDASALEGFASPGKGTKPAGSTSSDVGHSATSAARNHSGTPPSAVQRDIWSVDIEY